MMSDASAFKAAYYHTARITHVANHFALYVCERGSVIEIPNKINLT